jgi:hypothetical protein
MEEGGVSEYIPHKLVANSGISAYMAKIFSII